MKEFDRVANRRKVGQGIEDPVKWSEPAIGQQQRDEADAEPKPEQLALEQAENRVLPAQGIARRPNRQEQHRHPDVRPTTRETQQTLRGRALLAILKYLSQAGARPTAPQYSPPAGVSMR